MKTFNTITKDEKRKYYSKIYQIKNGNLIRLIADKNEGWSLYELYDQDLELMSTAAYLKSFLIDENEIELIEKSLELPEWIKQTKTVIEKRKQSENI